MSETTEAMPTEAGTEPEKKKAGRPRKNPRPAPQNQENENTWDSTDSTSDDSTVTHEQGVSVEDLVEDTELEGHVERLIDLVKGFTPTFNRQQRLSVVNLNSRNTGQGVKYRQLFVEEMPGFMVVSLREGFKSAHGGTDQKKTLNLFRVPISEFALYSRVQKRFFGYVPQKNSNEATLLLDTLEQTVRS